MRKPVNKFRKLMGERALGNSHALILFLLALVGFLLWQRSRPLKDFGLNFFTEILGAIVTILIIDQIIKRREEAKNIPQKLAAYEDVRLFMSRYLSFWRSAFEASVPENEPATLAMFFSENGMGKIWSHLNLDDKPNVTPPRTWWDWLVQEIDEFSKMGDKILQRHAGHLDPQAYRCIHQITESSFHNVIKLIPSLRAADVNTGFARPTMLQSYALTPSTDDYQAMIDLYVWCEETFNGLSGYEPTLKSVSEYVPKIVKPNNAIKGGSWKQISK